MTASEENTGSTITFTRVDEDNVSTTIHMTVFKNDIVANNDITSRTFSTTTENISDNISASVSVTPIVTYDAENAFAFDIQSNEQISFNFIRKNPVGTYYKMVNNTPVATPLPDDNNDDDDRVWSNRKWITEFTKFINCWQAEYNGCILRYVPLDPTLQHGFAVNVFLRNLSYNVSVNSIETITGSVEAQVGDLTGNSIRPQDMGAYVSTYNDPINLTDMTIQMSSSDGFATYILYQKKVEGNQEIKLNCVSKYTLKGGPEQPFEYLVMEISKKRLNIVAPNLYNDIIAGRNRIYIDAMGNGEFIVTKCSSTTTSYKIIAYSIYEVYRSVPIGTSIYFGKESTTKPFDVIRTILFTEHKPGFGDDIHPIYFKDNTIKYAFFTSNNKWADDFECNFNNNSSSWYVLSVCALKLNCKIWFADKCAYIIDTSITKEMLASPTTYGLTTNMNGYNCFISKLYLNLSAPYPLSATAEEMKFSKSICGETILGDEGAETIHNSVRIQFSADKDSRYVTVGETGKDTTELNRGGYALGITSTGVDRAQIPGTNNYRYEPILAPYGAIARSQAKYGIREVVYKIQEIGVTDANDIAIKVANDLCDSEQSVGFKIKEIYSDKDDNNKIIQKWQKFFPAYIQTDAIFDYSKDLVLSNFSNFACTTTLHKVTSSNFDDEITINIPKNTWFRLDSGYKSVLAGAIYSEAGILGDLITDGESHVTGMEFKIYSENNTDITSEMTYEIRKNYTISWSGGTFSGPETIDILITKPCYVNINFIRSSLISVEIERGSKVHFNITDVRQKMPNKLCMSTYEHNFPEGTTEYWFGIMKPTDVSQNSSEIANSINNQ